MPDREKGRGFAGDHLRIAGDIRHRKATISYRSPRAMEAPATAHVPRPVEVIICSFEGRRRKELGPRGRTKPATIATSKAAALPSLATRLGEKVLCHPD